MIFKNFKSQNLIKFLANHSVYGYNNNNINEIILLRIKCVCDVTGRYATLCDFCQTFILLLSSLLIILLSLTLSPFPA